MIYFFRSKRFTSIFLRFFLPGFTIHLQRGCIAEIMLTLTSQTLAVLIAACTRAYLCGSVQAIAWRPKSAGWSQSYINLLDWATYIPDIYGNDNCSNSNRMDFRTDPNSSVSRPQEIFLQVAARELFDPRWDLVMSGINSHKFGLHQGSHGMWNSDHFWQFLTLEVGVQYSNSRYRGW